MGRTKAFMIRLYRIVTLPLNLIAIALAELEYGT